MRIRLDRVVAVALFGAASAGCSIEGGPGCPSGLMAEPNGRDGNLFFVGGGYVQDGLWKQLTIPGTLQPDAFTITTATVEFHEPVCVIGASGFPLLDENGHIQCEFDVDARTTSDSCTIPPVQQDLEGVTVETTPNGNNVVSGVQATSEGIAIQVTCDLSLSGGVGDHDSNVHVVLREPDGEVRYEDTIWITCEDAYDFNLRYDRLVGEGSGSTTGEGIVHVGDEFYVRYSLLAMGRAYPPYDQPVSGYGMVSADANPPFEIVAYEHPVGSPPRLHLRALAPADHPHLIAGAIEGALPVTILP